MLVSSLRNPGRPPRDLCHCPGDFPPQELAQSRCTRLSLPGLPSEEVNVCSFVKSQQGLDQGMLGGGQGTGKWEGNGEGKADSWRPGSQGTT